MEVCLNMLNLFMKSGAKVILERYVKRFIGDLSIDQISFSSKYFQHCCVKLKEISFNTDAINSEIDNLKLPFEVVDCYAREINIEVDLTSSEHFISAKVNDLILTLDMTNSCDISDESLSASVTSDYEESTDYDKDSDFVKLMAQLHKSICHKLTIDIVNFKVRFQFISKISNIGIAIEANTNLLRFFNRYKKVENDKKEEINIPLYDNRVLTFTNLAFSIEEFIIISKHDSSNDDKAVDLKIEVDHLLEYSKDIILFCKIFGTQEFIFGYKVDDQFGPDIDLSLNLETVHIFLTPKQIKQFITALTIFSKEIKLKPDDKWKTSNQMPMTDNDYQTIDFEIKKNMEKNCIQQFLNIKESWSCQPDYDGGQTDQNINNYQSMYSDINCSYYSVKSEMEERRTLINMIKEIITNFTLNITAINAVILYEDLLLPSNDESVPFIGTSITDLQNKANVFFDKLESFNVKPKNNDELAAIKENLLNICPLNHLMLLVLPIKLYIQNNHDNTKFSNIIELSIGCLDVYENLVDECYTSNIIELNQVLDFSKQVISVPILSLRKSGNFISCTNQTRVNRNNISVSLGNCNIKLDFTIIKRLNIYFEVLNKSQLHDESHSFLPANENIYLYTVHDEEQSLPINVSIKATKIRLLVQFPIPDCTNRKESFAPKLRNEVIIIDFERAECFTYYDPSSKSSKYELFLEEVRGFFQEKQNYLKIPILRLTKNLNQKIMLSVEFVSLQNNIYGHYTDKGSDVKTGESNKESIFMAKTVISECLEEKSVTKDLLLPADDEYIESFFNKAKKNTSINLEANIPYAQISLPNKHIYEVLYNRFLLDLFVWFTEDLPLYFNNVPSFTTATTSDIFNFSHIEDKSLHHQKVDKPTLFLINVSIGEATASIRTPYKKSDKVVFSKHGEIIFKLSSGNFYITNTYEMHDSITFLCVDCQHISIFHQPKCNTISTHALNEDFNLTGFEKIVFPTKHCFDLFKMNKTSRKKNLLLSMEMKYNLLRNVSSTVLACGLYYVTLKYEMNLMETMWFNQLADVFQIEYVSISGYEHPSELTEINLYTSDCYIEYNPINLPLKSIISLGTLWVSLTSCYTSNKLSTHMFLEDCGLFFTKNLMKEISNSDFICVAHLGYFELCHNGLETNDSDLSVSNSDIHIRTCSDSCSALMELLIYLSNGGDLIKETVDIKKEVAEISTYNVTNPDNSAQSYMETLLEDAVTDMEPPSPGVGRISANVSNVEEISFPKRLDNKNSNVFECCQMYDELDILYEDDDTFCIIGSDIGTGIRDKFSTSEVTNLREMNGLHKIEKSLNCLPSYLFKYLIKEMTIVWSIYGGSDFSENQQLDESFNKTMSFGKLMKQDILLNSPSYHNDKREKCKAKSKMLFCHRGGKSRDHDRVMEFRLERIRLEVENFDDKSSWSSAVNILVKNIIIIDKIKISSINTFLYEDPQFNYPLCSNGYMMTIRSELSKEELSPSSESTLTISIRPLRLNIDQHALYHLSTFFTDILCNDSAEMGRVEEPSKPITIKPSLTIYVDGVPQYQQPSDINSNSNLDHVDTYIRDFIFHPALPIKVDYEGKGVVNSQYGSIAGLLIGLSRLRHSNISLKSLHYHGVLGHDQLFNLLVNDWFNDIRQNQIGGIVGGIGPMKAFSELFGGIRDLIWFPIEQYKKDGRILTGVKRGTLSFASSSAHATLDLAEKFLGCVQSLAEIMHDVVSQGPREKRKSLLMAAPPQDIRDGVNTAIGIITDGFGNTAHTIYRTALEEHSHKGVSGAVGGVIRQVAPTVMSPIIIGSEATCTVIEGLKNQLNPSERREAMEKWKK